ncbi:MAG: SpoIIE family protein phosphatase [Opitutaceae bacterium]
MHFLDNSNAAALFFNRLMESLPDHVYFKDREGRFLCVTQAHAIYLGARSPADVIGKTDFDFFEASQARQKDADEHEIIRTGVGFIEKEERASSIRGVERWVLSTKLPLLGDDGEIIGTFGISRNISEMKQAREALNAHHRLLSTLIEILPCRIFVKDRGGRIKLTNKAYRAGLGLAEETAVVGRKVDEIVPDPRVQTRAHNYAEDDRAVLERGVSILNREDWDASPMGDKQWLLLSKVPLRDASGQIDGMVGMAADITAQKEAEARAVETQHALEEKNRQVESELEIARELQTELMSASLQSVCDELDSAAPFHPRIGFHYEPSAHLAGDFFQFVSISPGAFAFILCDVMGHGVKAALVTTLVRGLLANLRADEQSPAEALRQLNERLCLLLDRPPLPRFVTALYALVDTREGRVRMASAGHPWPLRSRADGATSAVSTKECGPALGLIRGAAYGNFEFNIAKGDRLLFFTDGWTEETNTAGEEFGLEHLAKMFADCVDENPYAVLDQLAASLRIHSSEHVLNDDACAMLASF